MSTYTGSRNCNPGNLRLGTSRIGLAEVQSDPDFCRFVIHEFGIRAMSRTLHTYYQRHELRTIREFINRWAPPNENNIEAYVELLNILSSNELLDEPTEGLADDDDVPDVQNETVSKEGDTWLLGDHRLMCGDSTNLEHVERLVDNQSVDMVWTDPPYNVDYEGKTKDALKIDYNSMGDSLFRQFLRGLFISAFTVTKEGGLIYVAHADTEG